MKRIWITILAALIISVVLDFSLHTGGHGEFAWSGILGFFAVFGLIVWMRATWPRVRIDQLMSFAWKYMLPLSLVNLLVVAIEIIIWEDPIEWFLVPLNIAICVGLLTGWAGMFKLRGGPEVES